VPAREIPERVKVNGGFNKLASAHVKNPRRNPDPSGAGPNRDQRLANLQKGSTTRQRTRRRTRHDADVKGASTTVVLKGTLDESAMNLLDLSAPCRVALDARIESWSGDEAEVTIFAVIETDDDD
jgi:hypothetical protein